jgi:hypothetical protein
MTVTSLHRNDSPQTAWESEHQDHVVGRRAALLDQLDTALAALDHAAQVLDELRGPQVADTGLSYGRDGRDCAALIDHATRDGRCAFALLQMLFGGEGPRR